MSDVTSSSNGHRRVVCFGELLMRLAAPGRERLLQSPRLEVGFGGAEANVAASLAILGHDSVVVSTLPDQALGHACAGQLRRLGVDTAGVRFGPGRMGLYYLATGAMQRPSEVLYDRAGSSFAQAPAEAYDWPALLADAGWLHVSGITPALGEAAARATAEALHSARAAGLQISFDCNYRPALWAGRSTQAPALLRALVASADLLFASERDIALMLELEVDGDDPQQRFRNAADAAFAAWPRLQRMAGTVRRPLSVDEHELAGLLAARGILHATPRYRLTAMVDRIGAGDAFAAGLIDGLLGAGDDEAALAFATAAACLKHSLPGDVNLLGRADIEAFLYRRDFEVRR